MDRQKMSRNNRAKQFLPFDSMKGLKEAIKLKEYEHEKIQQGELSPEQAAEISNTLSSLKKGEIIHVTYYEDGYYHEVEGKCLLYIIENQIKVGDKKLNLDQIYALNKVTISQ